MQNLVVAQKIQDAVGEGRLRPSAATCRTGRNTLVFDSDQTWAVRGRSKKQ